MGDCATLSGDYGQISLQPNGPHELEAESLVEAVQEMELKIFGQISKVSYVEQRGVWSHVNTLKFPGAGQLAGNGVLVCRRGRLCPLEDVSLPP